MSSVARKSDFAVDGTDVFFKGEKLPDMFPLNKLSQVGELLEGKYLIGAKDYRRFTKVHGITPANFRKVYNGIFYGIHVKPYEKYAKMLGYGLKGINKRKLSIIAENYPIVLQYEQDGLHNLTPLAAMTGKSTKELKAEVGKAAWKALCRNSMTRNALLVKAWDMQQFWADRSERMGYLAKLNSFPSTILKRGHNFGARYDDAGLWAVKNSRYPLKDGRDHRDLASLAMDTARLAHYIGETVDLRWTQAQMQARHDAFHLQYEERRNKASTTVYNTLQHITVDTGEHQGYTYTLLKTEAEIRKEGKDMHHCVGMYSNYVAKGTYLVYHVESESSKYTLGITVRNIEGKARFSVNQQYRVCNEAVSGVEQEVSNAILRELNKLDVAMEDQNEH